MKESATRAGTGGRHAIVIGGGLAGLSATVALAQQGWRVTLLESRPRLGGRASSFTDPATGQLVDACQHVSMGCCTHLARFCRTLGIEQYLAPQPRLWFMTPDRRISLLRADPWPAPWHLSRALASAHYLTPTDKVRVVWGLTSMMRESPNADPPLLDWLLAHRQNERTIKRFWGTVLTSALNESVDRLGFKYARKVFRDGFVASREGHVVYLPTVPLGRFYGSEMRSWLHQHQVTIRENTAVRHVRIEDRMVTGVVLRDGSSIQADAYVLAVPFDRVLDLLPTEVRSEPYFAAIAKLEASPITSVHLWFDRPVIDKPHIVLVDALGQWVFNRGESAPGEWYVQVVVSASRDLRRLGREDISREIRVELARLFPRVAEAQLRRVKVVTEHAATFSVRPGVDRWRPSQASPLVNLALAGDWTDTGWPATMEGAVRSGELAAQALLTRQKPSEQIFTPLPQQATSFDFHSRL